MNIIDKIKLILLVTVFLSLMVACSSSTDADATENLELGSSEWCEKTKDRKESELTFREKEAFQECLLVSAGLLSEADRKYGNTPAEPTIFGKWEKTKINNNDRAEGWKMEKTVATYKEDNSVWIEHFFKEPTQSPENPKVIKGTFSISSDNEVVYTFGEVFEFSKIIELSKNKFTEQPMKYVDDSNGMIEDLSDFPASEYERVN